MLALHTDRAVMDIMALMVGLEQCVCVCLGYLYYSDIHSGEEEERRRVLQKLDLGLSVHECVYTLNIEYIYPQCIHTPCIASMLLN